MITNSKIIFLFLLFTIIFGKDCDYDAKKGDECQTQINQLYPTQFSIGSQEVLCKANLFSQMSKTELEDYLNEKKQIVLVIISQNRYYVIDGHHMIQGLWVGVNDNVEVNLEIIENWNDYTFEEFEEAMIAQNFFHLSDAGIGPISPILLPTFEHLDDDMFRTLSWLVRKAGGYDKGDVMYTEFIWADWLRTQIELPPPSSSPIYCTIVPYSALCIPDQKALLEDLIAPGLELALSPAASQLPGWHQGNIDAPDCGKGFSWNYGPWKQQTNSSNERVQSRDITQKGKTNFLIIVIVYVCSLSAIIISIFIILFIQKRREQINNYYAQL